MSSKSRSKKQHPYRHNISEFMNATSLHGMGYVAMTGEQPWYFDWFFFLAIGTGVICAVTLLQVQIQDYRKDKVQASFDGNLASNREVFFPSITVCNINRLRQSFLDEFDLNEGLPHIRKEGHTKLSPRHHQPPIIKKKKSQTRFF